MHSKWASRKFLMAMVVQVVGIVTLVWGTQAGEQVAQIAGAAISILSALGYIKVEGDVDRVK